MAEINWAGLYEILKGATPLKEDCSRLCRKKCCSVREKGWGVYLFPGEESMFAVDSPWCRIRECPEEARHFTGRRPLLLDCGGKCPRERRPLACRLFPLAPCFGREGGLELVLDPDALFICPLVRLDGPEALEAAFREGARRVWLELLKLPEMRENVVMYVERLDSHSADPWRKLLRQRE